MVARYEGDGAFFEIERDGCVVRTCTGRGDKLRRSETTHDSEDDARYGYVKKLAAASWGMRPAGRSQVLASSEPEQAVASSVLFDEYFAAGDDRFLTEARLLRAGAKLAAFAERWYADQRPWARGMLLAYVLEGCDLPDHKGLVKRLYKRAEAASDDDVIAHFMVAFDAMGTRLFVVHGRGGEPEPTANPELALYADEGDPRSQRFSRATRLYLARRAYRYFRRIAYRDPARYARGVLRALPHYRDEALVTPAQLLDAWGLMQALYGESPALVRDPRGMRLAYDRSLADLEPAPRWPDAWKAAEHFDAMLGVLVAAQSRTVRAWLARWLRAHHAERLAQLAYPQIKRLVMSPHDEVQTLGGELFGKLAGLESLAIGEWLELLAIENLDVVTIVARVVAQHVSPGRLSLEQCIALACARTAPVARLGLSWAREKPVAGDADLRAIAKITRAGVASVRAEGTQWVASIVTTHAAATPEHLRDLCDAPHADAREHALAAVEQTPKLAPPALWFALTESPYPDVRDVVIGNATRWRDAAAPNTLRHVWSSAMLAVHRGSAAKRRVARQIAERIASHPAEAEQLLPLLGVALRSVRPPERATALAALVRALRHRPELRALGARLVPELAIGEQVTR